MNPARRFRRALCAVWAVPALCMGMPVFAQGEPAARAVQGALVQGDPAQEKRAASPAKDASAPVGETASKARVPGPAERREVNADAASGRPAARPGDGKPSPEPASGSTAAAPPPSARTPLVVEGAVPPQAAEAVKVPEIAVRVSASQQRENAYRDAVNAINEGRMEEAAKQLRQLLTEHPGYDSARQALIGLALKGRRFGQAEALADERLEQGAEHLGFAIVSARLKLERADLPAALDVLQRSQPYARSHAEYQALMAAVLQRMSRHAEAVERFRAALALTPDSGIWFMGLGISLQAIERSAEAAEAFRRARDAANLAPELRAFVDERIAELRR